MSWFVHPAPVTVTLTDGVTIVVKSRLNTGETRKMAAAMAQDSPNGDRRHVDPLKYPVALVLAYLVDWTVTDDGVPVPIRGESEDAVRATLDNLEYERFTEILRAIEAHIARMDAARADEKKTTRTGATGSPPTSPSPSGAAGATNGSPSSTPTSMTSSSPS